MSISIRTTYNNAGYDYSSSNVSSDSKSRRSIYAKDLTLSYNDNNYIDNKRKNARNQAMKLINDAWNRDDGLVKNIQDLNDDKANQVVKKQELLSQMKRIDDTKEALRKEYGVSKDSDEQKDLELLEKYQNNKTGASYDDFTDEEIARLKELQNQPLTEYQKRILELNGVKDGLDIETQRIDEKLMRMTISILMAETDQAASQDMINSQDAADQVLEAAEKDIMLKLINDGKETVDDKKAEAEEKADKAEEKKEESQTDDAKTKTEKDNENIIKGESEAEQIEQNHKIKSQSVDNVAEVQKQIQQIMKDNNLINEDIKGIDIDFNF